MLVHNKAVPVCLVDARKEPLSGEEAWDLLSGLKEILVAKGKGYQVFDPCVDAKELILAQVLGRTGNLRAPSLRIGDRILVGFSEALYSQFSG